MVDSGLLLLRQALVSSFLNQFMVNYFETFWRLDLQDADDMTVFHSKYKIMFLQNGINIKHRWLKIVGNVLLAHMQMAFAEQMIQWNFLKC